MAVAATMRLNWVISNQLSTINRVSKKFVHSAREKEETDCLNSRECNKT